MLVNKLGIRLNIVGELTEQINNDNQVKSTQRVTDHGEVFTAQREVNAMLNLVQHETERIDSRFLEPACGTGNFLVEILRRKLMVVETRYSKNQLEYERYAILALSSIYGVDKLEDNVHTCRDRLLGIFTHHYLINYSNDFKAECLKAAEFILSRNILWGDALTLRTPNSAAQQIVFSEWSAVEGSMLKRRDFTFRDLLNHAAYKETPLFSDLGEDVFIPEPVKEYPLTHFLKIADAEE
jgi:hypothetical protein